MLANICSALWSGTVSGNTRAMALCRASSTTRSPSRSAVVTAAGLPLAELTWEGAELCLHSEGSCTVGSARVSTSRLQMFDSTRDPVWMRTCLTNDVAFATSPSLSRLLIAELMRLSCSAALKSAASAITPLRHPLEVAEIVELDFRCQNSRPFTRHKCHNSPVHVFFCRCYSNIIDLNVLALSQGPAVLHSINLSADDASSVPS
jgi:hypothetical protein